jgi:putative lipoic acid-binding regulatory protein
VTEKKMNYAEKAEIVTQELRSVVQEAHKATKDLRATIREANELRGRWEGKVSDIMTTVLREQMEALLDQLKEINDVATKKVYARFDAITKILMGEGEGVEEDMRAIALRIRATMNHVEQKERIPKALRRPQ